MVAGEVVEPNSLKLNEDILPARPFLVGEGDRCRAEREVEESAGEPALDRGRKVDCLAGSVRVE